MQISMIAAGFTASEAAALRRAMAAWKRKGCVDRFGMLATTGTEHLNWGQILISCRIVTVN